jgi:hypothetical protein
MSLNAISKHIKVLEKAGLVSRKTLGRAHFIEARTDRLVPIEDWLGQFGSIWEMWLGQLGHILEVKERDND